MTTQVFTLPDLGEGLTEADLVQWLVAKGDEIVVDQPVAEVETAKALVEVPSPYAGTVLTLHGTPGETLHVGNPLVTIGDPADLSDDDAPSGSEQAGALSYREEEQAGTAVPADDTDGASGSVLIGYGTTGTTASRRTRRSKRVKASASPNGTKELVTDNVAPRVISPLVRQLARRHGLDITQLTGSGPQGLILRADVEAAIDTTAGVVDQTPPTTPETQVPAPQVSESRDNRSGLAITERIPIKGVRKTIADQMVRSRTQIPEATAWLDVDVTELVDLREQLKTTDPETAPSLLGLIARFTIAALRRYPILNSRIVENEAGGQDIVYFDGINLGIAAQTDRGLVVPSVAHAEQLSARELTTEIAQLVEKARRGEATPSELTRGTFTLNNYGVFGTDGAAAIINAPEVAILGVGRIMDRPWVVDGELAVRKSPN